MPTNSTEPGRERLAAWGLDDFFTEQLDRRAGSPLIPARVVRQQGAQYRVITADGERSAVLAGRVITPPDPGPFDVTVQPAVGDWVGLDADQPERIRARLLRRSAFVRRAAGRPERPQIVAANVDRVLIVSSLDADFNPSRLERYLSAVWESGAAPVVVLSKADLEPEAEAARTEIESIALGVPVRLVSAHGDLGVDELRDDLAPGRTVAFVGSSGVGKSTLVNALLGHDRMVVNEVRESDGRGQHTTTHRELIRLPGGALLIDTPGMRELGLWASEGVSDEVFGDVAELASACRFRDCTHDGEPGCAIDAAIADGSLDERRLRSYRKLAAEEAYALRKQDKSLALAEERRWKSIAKQYRARTKGSPKV